MAKRRRISRDLQDDSLLEAERLLEEISIKQQAGELPPPSHEFDQASELTEERRPVPVRSEKKVRSSKNSRNFTLYDMSQEPRKVAAPKSDMREEDYEITLAPPAEEDYEITLAPPAEEEEPDEQDTLMHVLAEGGNQEEEDIEESEKEDEQIQPEDPDYVDSEDYEESADAEQDEEEQDEDDQDTTGPDDMVERIIRLDRYADDDDDIDLSLEEYQPVRKRKKAPARSAFDPMELLHSTRSYERSLKVYNKELEDKAVYEKIHYQPPAWCKGGFVLAIAAIITHILGLTSRIYVTNVIGDAGNNFLGCAYDIYILALILTSYCIPNTLSTMLGEKIAAGQYKRAYRLNLVVFVMSLFTGALGAGLTYLASGFVCGSIMKTTHALFPLRALCPAIFFVAVLSTLRGFMKGTGHTKVIAYSQILEGIVKSVLAIMLVKRLYNYGVTVGTVLADTRHYSVSYASNAVAVGTSAGAAIALIVAGIYYMIFMPRFRKQMAKDHSHGRESSYSVATGFIVETLPLFATTLAVNMSGLLSQGVFKNIADLQGYSETNISIWWGIYAGKYKLVMAVPSAIAFCVAAGTVTYAIYASQIGHLPKLREIISNGIRYVMVCCIPVAVFMGVFAKPVFTMLFPKSLDTIDIASRIMQLGAAGIVFYGLFSITTAYLLGLGQHYNFLQNVVFALVMQTVVLILCMLFPRLNIYAVVIGYLVFALLMCGLNLRALYHYYGSRPQLMHTFVLPLVISVAVTACSYGVYYLFYSSTENIYASVLVAMFVGVCIYLIMVLLCRCLTEDDMQQVPGGTAVADMLKRVHLL